MRTVVIVSLAVSLAVAVCAAPKVQVAPHLQARLDEINYPRADRTAHNGHSAATRSNTSTD